MTHPALRDDISKYVVHLTRRYDGESAFDNLLSILQGKVIYARNAHCLFKHYLSQRGFSDLLRRRFNTVCFSETPLTQIKRLIAPVARRQITLRPYGLVFYKATLLERGGSPAVYINAKGTQLRDYLLQQFRQHFDGIRTLKRFKRDQRVYHEQIIQYYSLINIISGNYDFTWEREWRFNGPFQFKYIDLVAIIAEDPEKFTRECQAACSRRKFDYIRRIPIISPDWRYEDIVETMSVQLWNVQIPNEE